LASSGGSVTTKVVDVWNSDQVNEWINAVLEKHGKIGGAVNFVGVVSMKGAASLKDLYRRAVGVVMGVNATAVLVTFLWRPALPSKGVSNSHLTLHRLQLFSGRSIVNAASVAGQMDFPASAAYVASKHAVIGLTCTAANRGGPEGVRVNAITL